jgi:thioredoxin 1
VSIDLTDNRAVEIINSGKFVIIDFFANWCGPCKAISPIIDNVSEKYTDKIIIGKINVDENTELLEQYEIKSIPTILFFRNGELIDKTVGAVTMQVLENKIKLLMSENININ